jgi:hypothetical protein
MIKRRRSLIINNCVALFLMYSIREQGPTGSPLYDEPCDICSDDEGNCEILL